jgi:hypothetical protein
MVFSVRYEVNIHNVYRQKRLGPRSIKTLIKHLSVKYIYCQINQFVHVKCFWVLRAAAENVRRTQSNEWNMC